MAKRKYKSRLHKIEERKATRATVFYVFLTIVLIFVIFFFGLPFVTRFASTIADLTGGSTPIELNDNTPPAPPRFDDISDYTNEFSVEISGAVEQGVTVKLVFNGKEKEIVANSEGKFSTEFKLLNGENTYTGQAIDKSGNESQTTSEKLIVYDNEDPKINISSPSDGDRFFGKKEQRITVEGTTEAGADLLINDRIAIVSSEGKFSMNLNLENGDNEIKMKATDRAGNESELSFTVTYSP